MAEPAGEDRKRRDLTKAERTDKMEAASFRQLSFNETAGSLRMKTHIIELKLESEAELYHPLDPNRQQISSDIRDFMLDRLQERKFGETIELHIVSPADLDREKVKKVFFDYAERELLLLETERKRNTLQQIRLFIIGILFILVSFLLQDKIHAVWITVISTIGAFSVWEATSIWIIKNPQLRERRLMIRLLRDYLNIVIEKAGGPQETEVRGE